jgi:hypothetical protein
MEDLARHRERAERRYDEDTAPPNAHAVQGDHDARHDEQVEDAAAHARVFDEGKDREHRHQKGDQQDVRSMQQSQGPCGRAATMPLPQARQGRWVQLRCRAGY